MDRRHVHVECLRLPHCPTNQFASQDRNEGDRLVGSSHRAEPPRPSSFIEELLQETALVGSADPQGSSFAQQQVVDQARGRVVEEAPAGPGQRPVGFGSVVLEVEGGRAAGRMECESRFLFEQRSPRHRTEAR